MEDAQSNMSVVYKIRKEVGHRKNAIKKHERSHSSEQFICDQCGKTYAHRKSLNLHIRSAHTTEFFECAHCPFKSGRKYVLQKHILPNHFRHYMVEESKHQKRKKKKVGQIKKKGNEGNSLQTPKFACPECDKLFTLKSNLTRHMTFQHGENTGNRSLHVCAHCSRGFRDKSQIYEHVKTCEDKLKLNQSSNKDQLFTCLIPECEAVLNTHYSMKKHYEEVHAVSFQYESLKFESREEFNEWRTNLQRNSACRFAVSGTWQSQTRRCWKLLCHRSGCKPVEKENRERFPKLGGSIKLNGFCPAEIILKENKTDKTCHVVIQKTHVGHSNSYGKESTFLNHDQKQRSCTISKLSLSVPLNTILLNIQMSTGSGQQLPQNCITKYDDIENIITATTDDPQSISSFVDKHQNSILFYKGETEVDVEFGVLEKKDFALVYMSEFQANLLKKYGNNVITYHVTPTTNPNDFSLHSIMIFDDDWENVAVAFLLSNRNDTTVLEIFLLCIQKRISVLSPLTIVTDMQTSFHDAFEVVMEAPQFGLWCLCCVYEQWRKNLRKIRNFAKQQHIIALLYMLSQITDTEIFEVKLAEFLNTDDPDLHLFIQYFKENYAEKARYWAYCYRIGANKINTSAVIQSFHNFFNNGICGKKKVKTVNEYLEFIETYINSMETKCVRPRKTQNIRLLRNRHRAAMKKKDLFTIHLVNSETDECSHMWLVSSFEKEEKALMKKREKTVRKYENDYNNEMDVEGLGSDLRSNYVKEDAVENENLEVYIVERHINFERKNTSVECMLCKVSFEEYSCTCVDYLIKCNICQHIHAVVLYCKENNCYCKCEPTSVEIELCSRECTTINYTNDNSDYDDPLEYLDTGDDEPMEDSNNRDKEPIEDLKAKILNKIGTIEDKEELEFILQLLSSPLKK